MVPSAPRIDKKICSAVSVDWGIEKLADSGPSWAKTSDSMLSRIAYTNAYAVKTISESARSETYVDLTVYENHVPNGIPG